MKNVTAEKPDSRNSREIESLILSSNKIRILHYAAGGTLGRAVILRRLRERGCVVSADGLDQLLASMTRKGWLKIKTASAGDSQGDRACTLTTKGHRALKVARQELKLLVAILFAAKFRDNDRDNRIHRLR